MKKGHNTSWKGARISQEGCEDCDNTYLLQTWENVRSHECQTGFVSIIQFLNKLNAKDVDIFLSYLVKKFRGDVTMRQRTFFLTVRLLLSAMPGEVTNILLVDSKRTRDYAECCLPYWSYGVGNE